MCFLSGWRPLIRLGKEDSISSWEWKSIFQYKKIYKHLHIHLQNTCLLSLSYSRWPQHHKLYDKLLQMSQTHKMKQESSIQKPQNSLIQWLYWFSLEEVYYVIHWGFKIDVLLFSEPSWSTKSVGHMCPLCKFTLAYCTDVIWVFHLSPDLIKQREIICKYIQYANINE